MWVKNAEKRIGDKIYYKEIYSQKPQVGNVPGNIPEDSKEYS